jgi:5-methylcytosine-specific restriction endonuclease McrA
MGESFYERRVKKHPRVCRDIVDKEKSKEKSSIYNSKRWKTLRSKMMAIQPICPDPFGYHDHKIVASLEVHHVVPLEVDPSKAFIEDNLVPLCRSCHASADALDRKDSVRQRHIMRAIVKGRGGFEC